MQNAFNTDDFSEESNQNKLPKYPRFIHGDAALALYKKWDNVPGNTEILQDVFSEFLRQEINHIQLHDSFDRQTAFPYTYIDVGTLARSLYQDFYWPVSSDLKPNHTQNKAEFIFGSFLNTAAGNSFGFVEEAMHQVIKALPKALEDIHNGKEPQNIRIYTLGSPTNVLGKISPEELGKIQNDPFWTLGNIYAEFVEQETLNRKWATEIHNIRFFGMSMGANFAMKTAETLLKKNICTQFRSTEENKRTKPFLEINARLPVSLWTSPIKRIQIPVGFLVDGILAPLRSSYIRSIQMRDSDFTKQVWQILEVRGLKENMSEEEEKRKRKSLSSIIWSLGQDFNIPSSMKVTKVFGLQDLTTYTPSFNKKTSEHREDFLGSLWQNLVSGTESNGRNFGIKTPHSFPFFRTGELKRMQKVVLTLRNIANS